MRRGGEIGSITLESALVLVVLFMLFLGLADAARMVYASNEMPYLAREGSRYAAVHSASSSSPLNCGQVVAHVQSIAAGVTPALLTVSVNGQTSAASTVALPQAPGAAAVIVTYKLNPVFLKLLGSSTTVSGKSVMPYTN
jgi:Flp pilus assembly protein TadG